MRSQKCVHYVTGPRRFGKTSVLKAAEDRLTEAGAVVIRCDAESYPSLDLLIAKIISQAAARLKGSVERTGDQIRHFFASLRPEVSFKVSDRDWTVKLGVALADEANKQVQLLVDALDGLEKLAQGQPKMRPVGLVVDEFQKIIERGGKAAEGQIRAAIQRHQRTGYVFAGSKTRLLTAMTMDAARPFYRLGTLRFIGLLPRGDFSAFLSHKFAQSGFTVARETGEAAVQRILELAEQVPYNVQVLAHACWDRLRAGKTSKERALTTRVVAESLDLVVRQYDPFYTQLWNGLTGIQQRTLMAVIQEHGTTMQSMKVARLVGVGPSTVRRSTEALMARDILREEEQLGRVRLRFEDPFFAQWILRFTAHS